MSPKHRVVLTDPHQHTFDETMLSDLQDSNAALEARTCAGEDQLLEFCSTADAVLTSAAGLTARVIRSMRHCRIIARIGTGFDNVDYEAAGEAGIPVTNVPDFCTEEVATHTMALLLAVTRKTCSMDQRVRRGDWRADDLLASRRLSRLTLGLVGFGAIGRAVAFRALSFGLKVIYFDPARKAAPDELPAARCDDLASLLAAADIISLHAPLNNHTVGLIGERQLQAMKRSAVLINTSRGAVVVEKDLVRALQAGTIAAAALDVFDPEPPPSNHPLFSMENIVLSPHCASHSCEAMDEVRRRALGEVIRALRGEPLLHVVNQDALDRGNMLALSRNV